MGSVKFEIGRDQQVENQAGVDAAGLKQNVSFGKSVFVLNTFNWLDEVHTHYGR